MMNFGLIFTINHFKLQRTSEVKLLFLVRVQISVEQDHQILEWQIKEQLPPFGDLSTAGRKTEMKA